MSLMGMDLNRITLGALIIALGLLVDDAIIAIEMMVVKTEAGWDRTRAAGAAWDITAFPMLTGTLVTAAGFIPVGFAASAVAEYAGGIFWVVAIALIVSWFVAVIFTPYLGVMLLPRQGGGGARSLRQPRPIAVLRAAIDACLRHRLKVIGGDGGDLRRGDHRLRQRAAAVLPDLRAAGAVPADQAAGGVVDHRDDEGGGGGGGRCSKGDADVEHATAYVGQGSVRFWLGLNPQLPNPSFAEIVILSKDTEARERIKARLEQAVADGALSEARVRVDRFNFGPPVGHPVQFRVHRQGPAGGAADRRRGARRDGAEPGRARSAPAVERDGAGDPAGGGPGPRPGAGAGAAGHRADAADAGLRAAGDGDARRHRSRAGGGAGGARRAARRGGARRSHGREPRRGGGAAGAGGADRAGGRRSRSSGGGTAS